MKIVPVVLVLALFLVATGCSSMKVYIDYEENVDFESFRTFKFRDAAEESMSGTAPLIHGRLVTSIENTLIEAGLEKVDSGADLFVTYYTSTQQAFRADTTHMGYGYPSRWNRYGYWGGVSSSTTRVSSYDVGTLVIDIWDTEDNILVWRGVANDTVPNSPEKLSTKLDKAIGRMVKQSQEKM
jgi:hypothetical protein